MATPRLYRVGLTYREAASKLHNAAHYLIRYHKIADDDEDRVQTASDVVAVSILLALRDLAFAMEPLA